MSNQSNINREYLDSFSVKFFDTLKSRNKVFNLKDYVDISLRFWQNYFQIKNLNVKCVNSTSPFSASCIHNLNQNTIYLSNQLLYKSENVIVPFKIFTLIGQEMAHLYDETHNITTKFVESHKANKCSGLSFKSLTYTLDKMKSLHPELTEKDRQVFYENHYKLNKKESYARKYEEQGGNELLNHLNSYKNYLNGKIFSTKQKEINEMVFQRLSNFHKDQKNEIQNIQKNVKNNYSSAEQNILKIYKKLGVELLNKKDIVSLKHYLNFQNLPNFYDEKFVSIVKNYAEKTKDYELIAIIQNLVFDKSSLYDVSKNIEKLFEQNYDLAYILALYKNYDENFIAKSYNVLTNNRTLR